MSQEIHFALKLLTKVRVGKDETEWKQLAVLERMYRQRLQKEETKLD